MKFRNYYRCAQCGCEWTLECGCAWTDVWSGPCNYDCPWCGARQAPYQKDEIEESGDE